MTNSLENHSGIKPLQISCSLRRYKGFTIKSQIQDVSWAVEKDVSYSYK